MINSLTLFNLRNHESLKIQATDAPCIFLTGKNGSGKTAVLEAISLMSSGPSLRGASTSDIARIGGDGGFSVHADLDDGTTIAVLYGAGDSSRKIRIDGDAAPLSNLAKIMRIIWLTPKEDRLFADGTEARRLFFDRMVSNFDHAHAGRTARLGKLLSERAFALKNGTDAAWLDSIEKQLASTAIAVAAARVKYAGELNYFLNGVQLGLGGGIESQIADGTAAYDIENDYLGYLADNRFLTGDKMICEGPHKTDWTAFNNVLDMPVGMTSTGQQKRSVLDIIIAHAKLIDTKTGAKPIILLDEAASHLDANARDDFFETLSNLGCQIWATGTDISTSNAKIIELSI